MNKTETIYSSHFSLLGLVVVMLELPGGHQSHFQFLNSAEIRSRIWGHLARVRSCCQEPLPGAALGYGASDSGTATIPSSEARALLPESVDGIDLLAPCGSRFSEEILAFSSFTTPSISRIAWRTSGWCLRRWRSILAFSSICAR